MITGFIDPNEQIADPNARAAAAAAEPPPDEESDDPDAEEEAPDTGPDPEEVAARLKKLKRLHKRYGETLAEKGVKDAATKKALKSLTNEFMELKLAPKVFDAARRPTARLSSTRFAARSAS